MCRAHKPDPDLRIAQRLMRARTDHQNGNTAAARRAYEQVLSRSPDHPDALYLLGLLEYREGRPGEAVSLILSAIAQQPAHAMAHAGLAQIYQDQHDHLRAVSHFSRALEAASGDANILQGLGLSLYKLGRLAEAERAFLSAIKHQPELAVAHNNLGNLQQQRGEYAAAMRSYQRCLDSNPGFAQAHNNLGVLHQARGRFSAAIRYFEAALSLQPDYVEALNNMGAVRLQLAVLPQALAVFKRAMQLQPTFATAAVNAAMALHQLGEHLQSRKTLDSVLQQMPDDPGVHWVRAVAELESVYQSRSHLDASRQRYADRLQDVLGRVDRASIAQRASMASLLNSMSPYLLPYQGRDDVELQRIAAKITQVVGGATPPPERTERQSRNAELRIGIVSGFFYDHSNWKIPIQGWLQALIRRYEVHAYYTGRREDQATREARKSVSHFTAGLSMPEFARLISGDQIDILIYPEIGMNPVTRMLAARRLAPLQCVSWGHPLSSGLPEMDCFLSSDLMEPDVADQHYSERLIRLPGLSFTWVPPEQTAVLAGKESFGFCERDVVYLCVQNLSKYLPQHDDLLLQIVRRQPLAKLVFIESEAAVNMALQSRLRATFGAASIDFDRHIRFLPRLDRDRYAALNRIADVFLDTPGWSGCNSTLEALWCDLPVVTLPGGLMRARHSVAIYRAMQYTELIALDEAHYVELAVRLGEDHAWREQQRARIAVSKFRVINDRAPSEALAACLPALLAQFGVSPNASVARD